jgi:CRISPR-associated endoribonuclease Cas6
MKYFELVVTLSLQEDIPFLSSYGYIGNLISRAMANDDNLRKLHKDAGFKFYTFCCFQPIEKDKIYRKGRIYVTNIRSLSVDFILTLRKVISIVNHPVKVIATDIRMYEQRLITELITLTPTVATLSNRCWTKEDGLVVLRERIHNNAAKKYRDFFGELTEPKDTFIEYIQQTNRKPFKIPYKQVNLLGNKLVIGVKPDEDSQKLAFTALGAGVLEKGSIGMGYCRAK